MPSLMCACYNAEGIQLAQRDGVDWILHIDTDELVYPGGAPEYSLQRLLGSVPEDVDSLVFPNYESMPERDDISDPFTEVGCFSCGGQKQAADRTCCSWLCLSSRRQRVFCLPGATASELLPHHPEHGTLHRQVVLPCKPTPKSFSMPPRAMHQRRAPGAPASQPS